MYGTAITSTDGVMVSMLAPNAVDRCFELRSGQTKDYEIGMCCFSDKNAAFRRKNKDWLDGNPVNVFMCDDMSIPGLLFK